MMVTPARVKELVLNTVNAVEIETMKDWFNQKHHQNYFQRPLTILF